MRGLKETLILFCVLLICATTINAQDIYFDSLAVIAGFMKPLILAEKDYTQALEENMSVGNLLTQFSFPARGKVISNFGYRSGRLHTGTDIKMAKGDTIYATFNGDVTCAQYHYGYGNLVIVQHEKNLETYYGHLSKFLTHLGSKIKRGEPIGLAGATGRATTSHLHLEIRENDQPYDPELVFNFNDNSLRPKLNKLELLADLNPDHQKEKDFGKEALSKKYVVQSGDSLWLISRRVKKSVESLCSLNNLSETTILQIGQVLNIN